MYLRADVFSPGLLLLSRALGPRREPAQAAAFGSTGMGYGVIVMFTLPNLLVGMLISGALAWGQLRLLKQRAARRRRVFEGCKEAFSDLMQIHWRPEPDGYYSTRWLTPSRDVRAHLIQSGICLPSGSNLTEAVQNRVMDRLSQVLTMGSKSHAIA
jgi:hypothetical protein